MRYLLDSNIIIYYFNGLLSNTKTDELLHDSFNVSVITETVQYANAYAAFGSYSTLHGLW